MTREEIDAKIAASEARGETGLERAMGEVRAEFAALRGDIKALPGKWTLLSSIFGTGLVVVGLILGALAFAGDRFDAGMNVDGVAQQAADRAVAAYAAAHPTK